MSAPISPSGKAVLRALALPILGLAACSDGATGPDNGGTPPPAATYALEVETRYIEVVGSCDANDIFGNPTDGEFQYRYTVSGSGQSHAEQSSGYNSVLGSNFGRKAGENINFTNRKYTWTGLAESTTINVGLAGAEWDTALKDSRMNNRAGSRSVPFAAGTRNRTVTIGANSSCQIRLHYRATWTQE